MSRSLNCRCPIRLGYSTVAMRGAALYAAVRCERTFERALASSFRAKGGCALQQEALLAGVAGHRRGQLELGARLVVAAQLASRSPRTLGERW